MWRWGGKDVGGGVGGGGWGGGGGEGEEGAGVRVSTGGFPLCSSSETEKNFTKKVPGWLTLSFIGA